MDITQRIHKNSWIINFILFGHEIKFEFNIKLRKRGIEPRLRTWKVRVLPLDYIRTKTTPHFHIETISLNHFKVY